MHSREEIKRVLAASGEPPVPGPNTAPAVWARIGARSPSTTAPRRLSWLPHGWELACAFISALAVGVISAEWRLRRADHGPTDHRRYLASIDPTVAPPTDRRP